MRFRALKLQKDRECPVCGDNPTVTKLIDYELFCGITPAVKAADKGTVAPELEATVDDLKERLDRGDVFLLDVREPREWDIARIDGATLIPLGELPKRMDELPRGAGHHRALQVRRPQREGRQSAARKWLRSRSEPQGRDPGVDCQGRPDAAPVLTRPVQGSRSRFQSSCEVPRSKLRER